MAGSSDYRHGDMNVTEQQATYELVMGMTKWGSLTIAAGALFLVLWFCTATGFLGAAATGIVVLALGITFLRSRPEGGH